MIPMKRTTKDLSEEEVEHIAWLAQIELTDEEKKLFTNQFNTIIDYFHIIDEADTKNVKPTFQILNLINVLREDIIEESMSTDSTLANAPRKEKGYFKAPKII